MAMRRRLVQPARHEQWHGDTGAEQAGEDQCGAEASGGGHDQHHGRGDRAAEEAAKVWMENGRPTRAGSITEPRIE